MGDIGGTYTGISMERHRELLAAAVEQAREEGYAAAKQGWIDGVADWIEAQRDFGPMTVNLAARWLSDHAALRGTTAPAEGQDTEG